MTANAILLTIGAHHHGHRVPADKTFDAAFHFAVAGIGRLLVEIDGVDVWRIGRKREAYSLPVGTHLQVVQNIVYAVGSLRFQ